MKESLLTFAEYKKEKNEECDSTQDAKRMDFIVINQKMKDLCMAQNNDEMSKLNDVRMIHNVLHGARIGLWVIELEEGKTPRMLADETMAALIGIETGLTPEETYEAWHTRIDAAYLDTVQDAVEKLVAMSFAEVSYLYHHPIAGDMFVRCGGIRDAQEKNFVSLSGYHQNITEIIQLSKEKERLRVNNEELFYSLHNIFYSLYRLNLKEGRILTLRGADDAELSGEYDYDSFLENCLPFIHSDDHAGFLEEFSLEHLCKLFSEHKVTFTREFRRKRNGEYRWTAFQLYFCRVSDGRSWGILGTRDVHERKCLDEKKAIALRDAYKSADLSASAKSEFLSKMSHDLRTPINGVLGMTQLAMRNLESGNTDDLMNCLKKIADAGSALSSQMNKLLTYSRMSSGQIDIESKPLDLRELSRDCVDHFRKEASSKEQTISMDFSALTHPNVLGDYTKLHTILTSFLSNAVHYTQNGGEIRLRIQEEGIEKSGNTTLEMSSGEYFGYCLSCEDNGPGISEEFLPSLFDPFTREADSRTTQDTGTGLGLAITKNLVTMMNGSVDVKSTPGKGSTFSALVYLKADETKDTQAVHIHTAGSVPAQAKTRCPDTALHTEKPLSDISILLVEDNAINREIAEELLVSAGATVTTKVNGKEAVDAFEAAPNAQDIILMDIMMPVMDGNEATRQIRALEKGTHIPIIALTANNFAEDVAISFRSGVDRHLGKPYEAKELFRVILELLADTKPL